MLRRGRLAVPVVLMWMALPFAPPAAAAFDLQPAIGCFTHGDNACTRRLLREAAAQEPQNAEIAYYLGRAAHRQQDWAPAVEELQRAVKLQPDKAEYQFRLALALSRYIETVGTFSKPGVARRIRDGLNAAVALEPDFVDARDALMKYELSAPSFLGGSLARAQEQAAEIAKRDPASGHIALAEIDESQHRPGDAIAEYGKAIALANFTEHDARVALSALYRRQQAFDAAFEAVQPILKKQPSDAQANYETGSAALACGCRVEDGIAAMKRTAGQPRTDDDDPWPAMVRLRLGKLYRMAQRKDDARAEFKAALELDPKLEEARDELQKLE